MSTMVLSNFVDCGLFSMSQAENIPANSGANFRVTFKNSFPAAPEVVVTPAYSKESPMWLANMSVGIVSRTRNDFVFRVLNNNDTARKIGLLHWIAVLPADPTGSTSPVVPNEGEVVSNEGE